MRSLRRGVQVCSLLGLVAVIWTTRYPLNGFVSPAAYFQLDPLVMFATAAAERVALAGLALAAATLAGSFVLGRFFCGWVCPMGALLDAGGKLMQVRGGGNKREKGTERFPRGVKYALLAVIALGAAAGVQLAWFLDPIAIFVRAFSFTVHPFVNGAVDRAFVFLLQGGETFGFLEPLYYRLKEGVLGVNVPAFPHTFFIFFMFLSLLGLVAVRRRFWCRYLCPLGALLAVPARFALLKRVSAGCPASCSLCREACRMHAIDDAGGHRAGECVLCMDCAGTCPGKRASFTFKRERPRPPAESGGMSRARFLASLGGSAVFLSGAGAARAGAARNLVRPPGSLAEEEFVQRCIRCGNCMKVCMTNTLQPALLEGGWQGLWTPRLDTAASYCEYQCTLCGQVCPTGAVRPLTAGEKMREKIGLAVIDRSRCLPWAKGKECLVCEEHCPVSTKAIRLSGEKSAPGRFMRLPYVEASLCVGCGICENKCPARPRAVVIRPL